MTEQELPLHPAEAELATMLNCHRMIRQIPPEAQARVIRWLDQQVELESPIRLGRGPRASFDMP